MLRKIINSESLKISQKNFYDRVSFSKVTSQECSDCDFTIKRTHQSFFVEYVPKTSYLKRNILRKNSMVDQGLNKVTNLGRIKPSILSKKQSSCKTFQQRR